MDADSGRTFELKLLALGSLSLQEEEALLTEEGVQCR